MKLTCVTATFNCVKSGNREQLIRCVESVAKLKTPHEHLIYDGASTDGTVDLLRELEKATPGLKVVSEPDTGIYNALNKGIRDANGEWFYVLGADDYILIPENMDRLLVEENCDEIVTPAVKREGIRKIDFRSIFTKGPYCHQGTIVKTAIIRQFGGYDERYRICADYDFYLKLHKAAMDIRYRDVVFAYYDGFGFSTTNLEKTFSEDCRISAAAFGSTPEKMRRMRNGGWPSLSVISSYLFHNDTALRTAARTIAKSSIKRTIRSIFWPVSLVKILFMNRIAKQNSRSRHT